jgi:uncharacterized protein YndB with AHSA1/START domain
MSDNELVEYTDTEIKITKTFDAPMELAFDVFTNPVHVRRTMAPFGETVVACDVDLHPGGEYRQVFLDPADDSEMVFRGTFLEVERPSRVVATWHFEGWPDVEAVESKELTEFNGVTTLVYRLTFATPEGRARMKTANGILANLGHEANLMAKLQGK